MTTNRQIVQRDRKDILNYVRSIILDKEFVDQIHQEYYDFPLVANLRNGLWYHPSFDAECYFKSTDGHHGTWNFSLRRLNIHVASMAIQHMGVCIVDSTRRGKFMPDSFSKTIPIWCAVLNCLMALELGIQHTFRDLCFLPPWIPDSEKETIYGHLNKWVQQAMEAGIDVTELLATQSNQNVCALNNKRISRNDSSSNEMSSDAQCTFDSQVSHESEQTHSSDTIVSQYFRPLRCVWVWRESCVEDCSSSNVEYDTSRIISCFPQCCESSCDYNQQYCTCVTISNLHQYSDEGTASSKAHQNERDSIAMDSLFDSCQLPLLFGDACNLCCTPIVCISASRRMELTEQRELRSWTYIQGAGDDEEAWSTNVLDIDSGHLTQTQRLTPALLWKYGEDLVASNADASVIRQINLDAATNGNWTQENTNVPIPNIHEIDEHLRRHTIQWSCNNIYFAGTKQLPPWITRILQNSELDSEPESQTCKPQSELDETCLLLHDNAVIAVVDMREKNQSPQSNFSTIRISSTEMLHLLRINLPIARVKNKQDRDYWIQTIFPAILDLVLVLRVYEALFNVNDAKSTGTTKHQIFENWSKTSIVLLDDDEGQYAAPIIAAALWIVFYSKKCEKLTIMLQFMCRSIGKTLQEEPTTFEYREILQYVRNFRLEYMDSVSLNNIKEIEYNTDEDLLFTKADIQQALVSIQQYLPNMTSPRRITKELNNFFVRKNNKFSTWLNRFNFLREFEQ